MLASIEKIEHPGSIGFQDVSSDSAGHICGRHVRRIRVYVEYFRTKQSALIGCARIERLLRSLRRFKRARIQRNPRRRDNWTKRECSADVPRSGRVAVRDESRASSDWDEWRPIAANAHRASASTETGDWLKNIAARTRQTAINWDRSRADAEATRFLLPRFPPTSRYAIYRLSESSEDWKPRF